MFLGVSNNPILNLSHNHGHNIFIIFWDLFMFGKTCVLPQVKRSVIVSNKHSMCELPHKLPNNLRKFRNIKKPQQCIKF